MDTPPVQYVKTSDGYDIAYTISGSGRPLVFLPAPFNHAQNDWESPADGPWLKGLSERMMLVRYDSRGQGLSTRGLPDGVALADYERDLETVVNHVPLNRFVLLAHTLFGHVAIRFATRNLHRVEALILNCSVSMRMRPGATVINQEIADKLVISLTTVRRHVSNIFDKTGAGNRAQATAYAKDHGLP